MNRIAQLSTVFALLAAGGCAVGPDYQRPETTVPEHYKSESFGEWKQGTPLDTVPRGAWWEVFADETLNDLELRAAGSNQDLKAAVARVDQARSIARVSRGELMPDVSADPSFRRERYSPNQIPSYGDVTANTYRAPLDLSYEIDLWGRVRRGFEGARAEAEASVAAFETVLLTLQADVATTYFSLRALDAEMASVARTIDLRREHVKLVRSRFEGGIGNELDVARAETELAVAETEAAGLERQRAELENALAVLAGENPTTFQLATLRDAPGWSPVPPRVPAGLPSDLLERRPDVAQAERQLAAANARIGVAKAAFFPVLRLTGSGGYVSGDIDTLFNWDSRVWSIGPAVSLPIFSGGRNKANHRRARASFDEAVARFRQQVLVSFRDIEDSLSGLHYLTVQAEAQNRAVASARRAAELAAERYRAGIVSYLEVVDADRAALQTERVTAQLAGQRLNATVRLIKALGGGWTEADSTPQMDRAVANDR